jgi:hypothetical protein
VSVCGRQRKKEKERLPFPRKTGSSGKSSALQKPGYYLEHGLEIGTGLALGFSVFPIDRD